PAVERVTGQPFGWVHEAESVGRGCRTTTHPAQLVRRCVPSVATGHVVGGRGGRSGGRRRRSLPPGHGTHRRWYLYRARAAGDPPVAAGRCAEGPFPGPRSLDAGLLRRRHVGGCPGRSPARLTPPRGAAPVDEPAGSARSINDDIV